MTPLLFDQERQETPRLEFPRLLDETLKTNGGTYRQIERSGQVAIYEGPKPGMFEVIVIRTQPEKVFKGALIPFREVYPSPEDWGTYGWTFTPRSNLDPLKAAQIKKVRFDNGR